MTTMTLKLDADQAQILGECNAVRHHASMGWARAKPEAYRNASPVRALTQNVARLSLRKYLQFAKRYFRRPL